MVFLSQLALFPNHSFSSHEAWEESQMSQHVFGKLPLAWGCPGAQVLIDHSVKGIAWSAASHIKSKLLKMCWCLIGRFLMKEVETQHDMTAEQERMYLNRLPRRWLEKWLHNRECIGCFSIRCSPHVFSAVGTPLSWAIFSCVEEPSSLCPWLSEQWTSVIPLEGDCTPYTSYPAGPHCPPLSAHPSVPSSSSSTVHSALVSTGVSQHLWRSSIAGKVKRLMDENSMICIVSACFSSDPALQNLGFYSHTVTKSVLSMTCLQRKLNSVCVQNLWVTKCE